METVTEEINRWIAEGEGVGKMNDNSDSDKIQPRVHWNLMALRSRHEDFVTSLRFDVVYHFKVVAILNAEKLTADGHYCKITEQPCDCTLLPFILAEHAEWFELEM